MAKSAAATPKKVSQKASPNHLYYGDNLDVLRESIADESIDLIYLDPPFNSQVNYNVLFRAPTGEQSKAQIEAFGGARGTGTNARRVPSMR